MAKRTLRGFLTAHLGREALGALTGQDTAALEAFNALIRLYGTADGEGRINAINAAKWAVLSMQSKVRHVARTAIAYELDWSDCDRLWNLMGLDMPSQPLRRIA